MGILSERQPMVCFSTFPGIKIFPASKITYEKRLNEFITFHTSSDLCSCLTHKREIIDISSLSLSAVLCSTIHSIFPKLNSFVVQFVNGKFSIYMYSFTKVLLIVLPAIFITVNFRFSSFNNFCATKISI